MSPRKGCSSSLSRKRCSPTIPTERCSSTLSRKRGSSTSPRKTGSSISPPPSPPSLPTPYLPTVSPAAPSFASLGVAPSLVEALSAMSITSPSEIQQRTIPDILAGRDCIGSSHTGSGKTVAFALPVLQALARDPCGCFCLVLVPTRELAFQIGAQFRVLGALAVPGFTHAVVVGGMEMTAQAIALRQRPHVIIATPGRLLDHLRSAAAEPGQWSLRRCRFLVLDEADRLLTGSFAEALGCLVTTYLPPPAERQTLLFTATLSGPVWSLALQDVPGKQRPVVHLCGSTRIQLPGALKQFYCLVPSQVKEVYLYYILLNLGSLTGLPPPAPLKASAPPHQRTHHPSRYSNTAKRMIREDETTDPVSKLPQTIIFVSRARTAESLHLLLESSLLPHPIRSRSLHSNLSQPKRLESIAEFEQRRVRLLISTELGSRGLDLKQVKAVINWDLPLDPIEYIHRVGRTARQNQGGVGDGISLSLVGEHDVGCLLKIEETVGAKLTEVKLKEDKVLEYLNPVSKSRTEAHLELEQMRFGERKQIHQLKRQKIQNMAQAT